MGSLCDLAMVTKLISDGGKNSHTYYSSKVNALSTKVCMLAINIYNLLLINVLISNY
jgi:hypothetical protein